MGCYSHNGSRHHHHLLPRDNNDNNSNSSPVRWDGRNGIKCFIRPISTWKRGVAASRCASPTTPRATFESSLSSIKVAPADLIEPKYLLSEPPCSTTLLYRSLSLFLPYFSPLGSLRHTHAYRSHRSQHDPVRRHNKVGQHRASIHPE